MNDITGVDPMAIWSGKYRLPNKYIFGYIPFMSINTMGCGYSRAVTKKLSFKSMVNGSWTRGCIDIVIINTCVQRDISMS